jgi:hypothetical protein
MSFFFDISQAFDKVWHEGLISKLIDIKLPIYLIKWIESYLKNRSFAVKVEDKTSSLRFIKCGVPQGAVLSPTLFSIYINDIPILTNKNKSYSLLFADDLVSFFIFKKDGHLNNSVKEYMQSLENWLHRWRLEMHPKKCNQMVFNVNSNRNINRNFPFKLFGDLIPSCVTLKFLGITFDIGLNFIEHIKEIKKKCINRLNIIKIISNKKLKLSKQTIKTTYLALIRSILDYSSIIIPCISKTLGKTIQAMQNTAIRIIYRLKFDTHTDEIIKLSGIPRISNRAQELNENYLKCCTKYKNELIRDLIKEYSDGGYNFRNKTFLCLFKNIIK